MKRSLPYLAVLISFIFLFFNSFASAQTPLDNLLQKKTKKLSIAIPPNVVVFEKIRVAVLKDQSHFLLTVWNPYQLQPLQSNKVLKKGWELRKVTVEAVPGGIKVDNEVLAVDAFRIVTKKTSEINKYKYKGSIEIRKMPNGKLIVINEVSLEDYLKGVLPKEVSSHWPMESLKAQAVASRTYALFHVLTRQNQDYVLESTVQGQVYGGAGTETVQTNHAVEVTRGEVLTFNKEVFKAYFHATCGGHTTRADSVWDVEPFPPLQGVECPFDKASKHFHWVKQTNWEEMTTRLKKAGYKIGHVESIEPQNIDDSGRALSFLVKHSGGTIVFNSNDFRLSMGPELIRSTRFDIRHEGNEAIFTGLGWGHGVGLCQWGAKGMAEQGFTYKQILSHYYPGTEIIKI